MQNINLRAGQTSQPVQMGVGSTIGISAVAAGSFSGYFEYTYATSAQVSANLATWTTWPLGTVTAATQDRTLYPMFVRCTCLTGQITAFFGDSDGSLAVAGTPFAAGFALAQPSGAPGGIVAPSVAWANRPLPASSYFGGIIRVPDVGGNTNTGGGNYFYANANRWKPLGGNILLDAVDTANTSVANTTEQNLNPNHIVIPAGVLGIFDRLRIRASLSKSSTADTATINIRFGPLGTTSDPIIATTATLATTNVTYGALFDFRIASNTTIQKLGNGSVDTSYAGPSATAFPAAVTISNISTNGMYLSITSTMTAGTETVTLQDYTLECYPTDSN